jgi:hypothetical protein
LKRVALRAEILSLPAAEVEAVTRNKAARTFMIEEAQRTRLLDAGQGVERIAWISFEGQRTLLEWERAREYLHEVSGDTATLQAALTTSFLEVCPTLDKDGATFGVSVACQDQRLVDLREGKTRDGTLESPAMEEIATRARIEIPSGRIALFRWTLPEKDGEPRRSHLLVLTPTLIP